MSKDEDISVTGLCIEISVQASRYIVTVGGMALLEAEHPSGYAFHTIRSLNDEIWQKQWRVITSFSRTGILDDAQLQI